MHVNPNVVFPIFITEPGSVYAYDSFADAELDLEPVDVEAGAYRGYDSMGRKLELTATGIRRSWLGSIDQSRATISISAAEHEANQAMALRLVLIDFLTGVEGGGAAFDALTLEELERRALPHARVRPQRSWSARKTPE